MSGYEEINNSDLLYLKNHFGLSKVDFFKDVIKKKKLDNVYFFLFPFKNSDNEIVNERFFNINIELKKGKDQSYWKMNNDIEHDSTEYIFLSDNPLALLKYYSKLPSNYMRKKLLFIVPFKFNYDAIRDIKEEYHTKGFTKIITVFDNITTKDLFSIITNSAIAGKKLKIKSIDSQYEIRYKRTILKTDKLEYPTVNRRFNLSNNIYHKKND